jgi:hypothetical protein
VPLPVLARRTDREPFCPDGLAVLAEYQRRQVSPRAAAPGVPGG